MWILTPEGYINLFHMQIIKITDKEITIENDYNTWAFKKKEMGENKFYSLSSELNHFLNNTQKYIGIGG